MVADLLVKIVEIPHPRFKRTGCDLIYVHHVSLVDALCAAPFEVETLDHRHIMIPMDEVITPTTRKLIPHEGMPVYKDDPLANLRKEQEKGNLFITFDIEFPKYIPEAKKQKLKELLLSP